MKKVEFKSIAIGSVFTLFNGIFLIAGFIFALFGGGFIEKFRNILQSLPLVGSLMNGLLGALIFGLITGIVSGIFFSLIAAIYNLFAALFGGITIDLEEK